MTPVFRLHTPARLLFPVSAPLLNSLQTLLEGFPPHRGRLQHRGTPPSVLSGTTEQGDVIENERVGTVAR